MPEINFYDPVCPVPEARQKEATKALNKAVDQADLERYPYIDIAFGDGGLFTYRCYSDPEKKIGQQGPSGACKI
ncbi:unnamed protein product [Clonostachys rhizophaga]|uniref:Uncharacterized protein n=1 Tax=Clonostachys rhizophaga TaxID=160324 RepID=A0A9N9YX56_9HYPO|nr:unnamed protein product [Clonostachys rhizophaga]